MNHIEWKQYYQGNFGPGGCVPAKDWIPCRALFMLLNKLLRYSIKVKV